MAIKHADWGVPGQALAAIALRPGPRALDLQAALLDAVSPFTGSGGGRAAIVTPPGAVVGRRTRDWVGV